MNSQTPLKKSLSRKEFCLNGFPMQTKVPCFGKKMPQKTFEKQVPGFKAGKERLTLLVGTNAVGFMNRTVLIYDVVDFWALKGIY